MLLIIIMNYTVVFIVGRRHLTANKLMLCYVTLRYVMVWHRLLFPSPVDTFTDNGRDIAFGNYSPTWKLHRALAAKALK